MKKALATRGATNQVGCFKSFILSFLAAWLFLFSQGLLAQDVLVGLTSAGGKWKRGTAFSIRSNGTGFALQKSFAKLGTAPEGDLVQGNDGNFYGMTRFGGNYTNFVKGCGTIFRMTPKGEITLLHQFDGKTQGSFPQGSLVKGPDGNFYGLTFNGGTALHGTAFRITPSGTYTVIHNFDYYKGGEPTGSLVLGKDGNFYGMTRFGGTGYDELNTYGVVFKLTPAGVYTKLYTFTYDSGGQPYGNLVQGKDGNFYGMTEYGGGYPSYTGYGSIFKITPAGVFTRLVSFDFNNTGGQPHGSLVEGPDGYFYGMTTYGGPAYGNYGVIFKVSSSGHFIRLYDLNTNAAVNGGRPNGSLLLSTDGNFYGMTQTAGAYNAGTIFRMTPAGAVTALHQFNPVPNGGSPLGTLVRGSDGNFYGMTNKGGSSDSGTIFRMTPAGVYTVLAHLPDDPSGGIAKGSVVQARDGNYYGFTSEGGVFGYGAVFRYCNNNFTVIRSLNGGSDGRLPNGDLVQGRDGNFYGMTYQGGKYGYGTIIRVTPAGALTVLRNLNGTTDGANPWGSLVQGADSSFYGMTVAGGVTGYGTIFKITPAGTFTVLRSLNAQTDGANPFGNLIQAKDGAFYGVARNGGRNSAGTIFRITSSGAFSVLRHFTRSYTDGSFPVGSLIQSTDGNLYGLTDYGGSHDYGTVFKITPSGTFTILYSINGAVDGYEPKGSLVRGSDGAFYGLNASGGTHNGGSIFRVTAAGAFTVLRHLNPNTDGGTPLGSLVVQKANPVAHPKTVTTSQNTAKKIKLTATASGSPIVYAVAAAPLNGTATIVKDSLTYTPRPGYVGADSLYFTATWGCQKSGPAKIRITVGATGLTALTANDAPGVLPEGTPGALQVQVAPNPSSSYFNLVVHSNSVAPITIRVYDALGRSVETKAGLRPQAALQVGGSYPAGYYIVEVEQDGRRQQLKLVKGER